MLRRERARRFAVLALAAVLALSAVPAWAGEQSGPARLAGAASTAWEGLWMQLIAGWAAVWADPDGPSRAKTSSMIDPNGQPQSGTSADIDPNGQPHSDYSGMIDPDGQP